MSHLSFQYFFFLSARGEGGAHFKSVAAEIKTWWRVPECMFARKKEQRWGRGLNLYLGVSFSMSVRCLRGGAGVLTGQSHLYTDTLTLHTEAAGSSFALFMKWCHYLLFYKHVCVHPRQACVHVCLHWWVKKRKIKTDKETVANEEGTIQRKTCCWYYTWVQKNSLTIRDRMKDWEERSI